MHPALCCYANSPYAPLLKRQELEAAVGDAAYETLCSDEDVEGDVTAPAAIAAAVAAASGAGARSTAAENAMVEGTPRTTARWSTAACSVHAHKHRRARDSLHLPARKHPSQDPALGSCRLHRYMCQDACQHLRSRAQQDERYNYLSED
jgi:hypothetical protein